MTNADEIQDLFAGVVSELERARLAIIDDEYDPGFREPSIKRLENKLQEYDRRLDALLSDEWASADEALPEEGEEVFVHDGGTIKKAKYSGGCFHDMLHYRIRPSHWMYPPELPTED